MAVLLQRFFPRQSQTFIAPQAFELFAHPCVSGSTAIDISFTALELSDQANPGELAYF